MAEFLISSWMENFFCRFCERPTQDGHFITSFNVQIIEQKTNSCVISDGAFYCEAFEQADGDSLCGEMSKTASGLPNCPIEAAEFNGQQSNARRKFPNRFLIGQVIQIKEFKIVPDPAKLLTICIIEFTYLTAENTPSISKKSLQNIRHCKALHQVIQKYQAPEESNLDFGRFMRYPFVIADEDMIALFGSTEKPLQEARFIKKPASSHGNVL